jgi:hypothetical protein
MFSNIADCKLICKEHSKPLNNPTSGISLLEEALLYVADPEQMCMWNAVGLLDNKAHLLGQHEEDVVKMYGLYAAQPIIMLMKWFNVFGEVLNTCIYYRYTIYIHSRRNIKIICIH